MSSFLALVPGKDERLLPRDAIDRNRGTPIPFDVGNNLVEALKMFAGIAMVGIRKIDEQERLFTLWYQCRSGLAYATSPDGLNWEKPALGLENVEGRGPRAGPESNVFHGPAELLGIHCNRFEADSTRRYKTLSGYGHAWFSSEGIRWIHHGQVFGGGAEVNTTSADLDRGHYLAFPKLNVPCYDGTTRRSVALTTSHDFVSWGALETVLIPDELDDKRALQLKQERHRLLAYADQEVHRGHFYALYGHPYGDHHYVGLMLLFCATGYQHHPGWEKDRAAKTASGEDGVTEMQIAFSRDMKRWHRPPDRKPVIGLGDVLSWEGGNVRAPSMIVHDDEIQIYYSGEFWTHSDPLLYGGAKEENFSTLVKKLKGPGWGIGVAKLRLDGFASADAGGPGGTLTTKLMELQGIRLTINARALKGHVAAEVLDADGAVVPGFGLADCSSFSGDSLRHTLTWKGSDCLGRLLGQDVRIRFSLHNASLFSYTLSG